jgi:hypothetical protein
MPNRPKLLKSQMASGEGGQPRSQVLPSCWEEPGNEVGGWGRGGHTKIELQSTYIVEPLILNCHSWGSALWTLSRGTTNFDFVLSNSFC